MRVISWHRWVLVWCSVTITACRSGESLGSRTGTTGWPGSSVQLAPTVLSTLDEHFLALGDSISGFAGFVLNEQNTALVVMLTDLSASSRSIQVLPRYRRQFRLGWTPSTDDLPLEFRTVQFSWKQLMAWATAIQPLMASLGTRALTRFDIDESRNLIDIGVADQPMRDALESRITSQLGVPAAAVTVRVVSPYSPTATIRDAAVEFRAGYQIEYSGEAPCTAGFFSELKDVPLPYPRVVITAAHCSDHVGLKDEALVFQPLASSDLSRSFGSEVRDAPPFQCAQYERCRRSDAAYIRFESSTINWIWQFGARTEYDGAQIGSISISTAMPSFDFGWRTNPVVNQRLSKVGSTTGWTTGTVTSTGVSFYSPSTANTTIDVYLLNQVDVALGCDQGDSGGPVFTALNQYVNGEAVGSAGILISKNVDLGVCTFSPMINVHLDNGAIEEYSG